jgi:putative ABC transport system substrate-binding protein
VFTGHPLYSFFSPKALSDQRREVSQTVSRWMFIASMFAAGCLSAACGPAKENVPRIAVLQTKGEFVQIVEGFKSRMRELGYVEGKSVTYDVRETGGDAAAMRLLAEDAADNGADLLFAVSTPLSLAAKEAGDKKGIPTVFAYAAIEGTGLVRGVSDPGGNITGVRYPGPESISKRLELLKEIVPRVKRVWICYDLNNPNNQPVLPALRRTAAAMGVTLVEVPAGSLREVEVDLERRAGRGDPGMDAMILMPDGFNHSPAGLALIGGFAVKHRIPLGGSFRYTADAGAIFGNANNLTAVGRLAASLADKILKGVPAETLPVLTPVEEFWINPTAAGKLGLSVPGGLLKMAEIVDH